ncbi:hypothetical protein VAE122_3650002 [Vibrio aestuarianus]|nr:hypothetical protein VAE122_3650002 [Vibrio aestuarianus]
MLAIFLFMPFTSRTRRSPSDRLELLTLQVPTLLLLVLIILHPIELLELVFVE